MPMNSITPIKRLLSMIQSSDRANAYKLFFVAYMLKYEEIMCKQSFNGYGNQYFLEHIPHLIGKSIQNEDLARYLSKLFTYEGITQIALEKEFKVLLDGSDVNVISDVFSLVNEFKITSLTRLKNMVTALLENVEYIYKIPQSFFDVHDLIDYIKTKILQCDSNMTVYDGFCKLGASINAVADGKATLYFQDIEQSCIPVALIITTILGNRIGQFSTESTFANPIAANKYFDRIVLDPPLEMKIEKNIIHPELAKEISINISDAGVFAMQHAYHHLKDDGIAIVRVSAGVLSKGGHTQEIRKYFVDLNCIDAVIWLPAYERARNTANTALVVLRKNNRNDDIYMLDGGAYVRDIKGENTIDKIKMDFPETYKSRTEKKGISRSVQISEIIKNDYNLSPLRYVSKQSSYQTTVSREEIKDLQDEYRSLFGELEDCDERLNTIRKELFGGNIWK